MSKKVVLSQEKYESLLEAAKIFGMRKLYQVYVLKNGDKELVGSFQYLDVAQQAALKFEFADKLKRLTEITELEVFTDFGQFDKYQEEYSRKQYDFLKQHPLVEKYLELNKKYKGD